MIDLLEVDVEYGQGEVVITKPIAVELATEVCSFESLS